MPLFIDGQPAKLGEKRFGDFHGNSVFTTFPSQSLRPFLWSSHWERLLTHAHFFGFKLPKENIIYQFILGELKNIGKDQKIRLIIYRDQWALTMEDLAPVANEIYHGVNVFYSSIMVHPQLAFFKTGNSLPYFIAKKEAENLGFFEALLINEHHHLVDGSRTSILSFDGQTLFSFEGGLKGTMREEAIKYAQKNRIAIKKSFFKKEDIKGQMLLSNSLLGVIPVGAIKYDFIEKLVTNFRMDIG